MPLRTLATTLLLTLVLVACADRSPARSPAPAAAPAMADPAPAPVESAPEQRFADDRRLDFAGFDGVAWGADEAAVRAAWQGSLRSSEPPPGSDCRYLMPVLAFRPPGIGFMIVDGAFVRADANSPDYTAPGGARTGLSWTALATAYPDAVTSPHKFAEGHSSHRIVDPDGGPGVLVVETGPDGLVTSWRIGIEPQVDRVERCH